MGKMKTFIFVGFERWGNLRPALMWKRGRCFKPVALGVWIRWPMYDRAASQK
jgi:hypothetical protein